MSTIGSNVLSVPRQSDAARVLDHHLRAFALGLDELMLDYSDDSIVMSPDHTFRGKEEIRGLFKTFLDSATAEFWNAFAVKTNKVEAEVAYITWAAPPFVLLATDTLCIRNGIIEVQTFTAFSN